MMTIDVGLSETRESPRNFMRLLRRKWAERKFLCIGLDSDYAKIPDYCKAGAIGSDLIADAIRRFNFAIVNVTKHLVGAYKLNLAFYIQQGVSGIKALERTIVDIHIEAPDVPVILDGKFGDIGNTNAAYAAFAFDEMTADAVTLHNYMGYEAMLPFLERRDKGCFILCKTSNPGSFEFQDLKVRVDGEERRIFEVVAEHVWQKWDGRQNCGLVAGATYPTDIAAIRRAAPDLPLLIPGIGKQSEGKEDPIRQAVTAGRDEDGEGYLLNNSSAIIFASSGPDFAEAALRVARQNDDAIQACY